MAEICEVDVHRELVEDKVTNITYNMSTLEMDEKHQEYFEKIKSLTVQMSNLNISKPETQEFDVETQLFLLQLLQTPIRTYDFLGSPLPYLMEETMLADPFQLEYLILDQVCRYLIHLKHKGYVIFGVSGRKTSFETIPEIKFDKTLSRIVKQPQIKLERGHFGWKQVLIQSIGIKNFIHNEFGVFTKNNTLMSVNNLIENCLSVAKFILPENLYYACVAMKICHDIVCIYQPIASRFRYSYESVNSLSKNAVTKHSGLNKLNISQNVEMKLFYLQSRIDGIPYVMSLKLEKMGEANIYNKCLENSSSIKECEAMVDNDLLDSADNNINAVAIETKSPVQFEIKEKENIQSKISSKKKCYDPKDYFTSIWPEIFSLYQLLPRGHKFKCPSNKQEQTDNNQNVKIPFNTANLSPEPPREAIDIGGKYPDGKPNIPHIVSIPVVPTNSFPNTPCTTRQANVPQVANPLKMYSGTSHVKTMNLNHQTAKPITANGTSHVKTINLFPQTTKPIIANGTSHVKTINLIPQTAKPITATGTSHTHFNRRYHHYNRSQNVNNNNSQFGKTCVASKSHCNSVDVLKMAFEQFKSQLDDLEDYSAQPEPDEACKVLRQSKRWL